MKGNRTGRSRNAGPRVIPAITSAGNVSRATFPVVMLIAVFGVYAAAFIARSSFVLEGTRYFSLFDDAMISMTFAKHFAAGQGLVWSAGSPLVEGFTNPLWVFFMAALHFLPVPAAKICLLVQIAGALFIAGTLAVTARLARFVSDGSALAVAVPVFLAAFFYPLVYWSLMGMEVGVLAFMLSVAAWLALRAVHDGTFPRALYLVLGVATLVRIDMAVTFLGFVLMMAAVQPERRMCHLLRGALILAAFLGLQTALRYAYYGEILPNTYYLKMTGMPVALRIAHGAYVLARMVWRMNAVIFLLPFVLAAVRGGKYPRMLAWIAEVQIAYSVYVGGDAWETWGGTNRFISIAMPVYFVLLAWSLRVAVDVVAARIPASPAKARTAAVCVLVVVSILSFNGYALRESLFLAPPYQVDYNAEMVERARIIDKVSTPEASVALTWAGTIPYFVERRYYDMLGKNDPVIAREPIKSPDGSPVVSLVPGHMKWDYDRTIGKFKPDIIPIMWNNGPERAMPYLHNDYVFLETTRENGQSCRFWFRKSGNHLRPEFLAVLRGLPDSE